MNSFSIPVENRRLIKRRSKPIPGVCPTPLKDGIDFLESSISSYFLIVGINHIVEISSIQNKVLATTLLTALPYFLTRVVGFASKNCLDKKEVSCDNFSAIPARMLGLASAACFGAAMGGIGFFKSFSNADLAYTSSVGMIVGKSVELIAYRNTLTCQK